MSTVITALFNSPVTAGQAIRRLEAQDVHPDRISLIAGEGMDREAFGIETHSKLSEGVAIGATSGAAITALVAGLTSIGTIATGGIGLLAAGPIVAALAGAGAGAAGGGILGGLIGYAIPEHEIKHYEDAIEKGAVLIGVECEDSDEASRVRDILGDSGAQKISHA